MPTHKKTKLRLQEKTNNEEQETNASKKRSKTAQARKMTEPEPEHKPEQKALPPALSPDLSSLSFQPTTAERVIRIPLASSWSDDLVLRDDRGQFVAKVLKHEKYGHTQGGDAKWRVTFGNEQDQVMAVLLRKIERAQDVFVVYSTTPNWSGQTPEPYYLKKGKQEQFLFEIYPLGELKQGVFGGGYRLQSSRGNHAVLLEASNRNITWALLCCPLAILCGCCHWRLSFYEPGQQGHRRSRRQRPAIVRDQEAQVVRIAAGASPLLGICIAYAVDRQVTVSC